MTAQHSTAQHSTALILVLDVQSTCLCLHLWDRRLNVKCVWNLLHSNVEMLPDMDLNNTALWTDRWLQSEAGEGGVICPVQGWCDWAGRRETAPSSSSLPPLHRPLQRKKRGEGRNIKTDLSSPLNPWQLCSERKRERRGRRDEETKLISAEKTTAPAAAIKVICQRQLDVKTRSCLPPGVYLRA